MGQKKEAQTKKDKECVYLRPVGEDRNSVVSCGCNLHLLLLKSFLESHNRALPPSSDSDLYKAFSTRQLRSQSTLEVVVVR